MRNAYIVQTGERYKKKDDFLLTETNTEIKGKDFTFIFFFFLQYNVE